MSLMRSALACTLIVGLAACSTREQQAEAGGALVGAGTAFTVAKILDLNSDWTLATTLVGAATGMVVASNAATNECITSNGDGTYNQEGC